MALLFLDGFDHYAAAQAIRKWNYVGPDGAICPGRFNGSGFLWTNVTDNTSSMYIDFPSTATVIIGMAFSCDFGNATNPFLILQDNANHTQIDLRVDTDAHFTITRNGVVLDATDSDSIEFQYWNYLEFRVTCDATTGAFELRINGATISKKTVQNTRAFGTSLISRLRLQPFAVGTNCNVKFDDLYVLDGTGSFNNDFLGECRVQTNYPNGDGSQLDFVPKTGILHYAMVNEQQSDDDISFNAGGAIGQRELYHISPFNFTGTIFGVQLNVTQRKDDVGNRMIAIENRQGGIDYEATPVQCLSQYKDSRKLWEKNPNGNVNWSLSQLNAAEFGLTIKS